MVLITLLVSATLAMVPIFVNLYRLPGDMVAGGCNSLVLSAACHAFCPLPSTDEASSADEALLHNGQSSWRLSTSESSSDNDDEEQPPAQATLPSGVDDDGAKKALITLSQSKLRDAARETGQEALHLSFATEETFISSPVAGERYM